VHRYRPKGLIPSVPVSVAGRPVPSVELGSESLFVVEAVPFDLLVVEFFLPGPESDTG